MENISKNYQLLLKNKTKWKMEYYNLMLNLSKNRFVLYFFEKKNVILLVFNITEI